MEVGIGVVLFLNNIQFALLNVKSGGFEGERLLLVNQKFPSVVFHHRVGRVCYWAILAGVDVGEHGSVKSVLHPFVISTSAAGKSSIAEGVRIECPILVVDGKANFFGQYELASSL